MTPAAHARFGIYADRGQLDHDVDQLIDELLMTLAARGVDRGVGLAAVRRVLREGERA